MAVEQRHPFESIESAQEFIELLADAIGEAQREIEEEYDRTIPAEERRREAWLLALHKVKMLGFHLQKGRRALKDLRTLRRLLDGELAIAGPTTPHSTPARKGRGD
jgi:hypothetical protein